MTPEQAAALRKEFPASAIGKLPKPTRKDNAKGKCAECGGYHGLPAVHLDYVGHAATTDRLLQVDPEWTWEPMAYGPNGEPLFTNGGLWIWLTVAGVRKPGYGDGATPKEVIGDAIRNAAMRFGVALDLWAKEDLHGVEDAAPANRADAEAGEDAGSPSPFTPPPGAADGSESKVGQKGYISKAQLGKINATARELAEAGRLTGDEALAFMESEFGKKSKSQLTSKEASQLIEWMLNKNLVPAAAGTADDDIPF